MVSILWIGSEIVLALTKHSRSADSHRDGSSLRVLWITIGLSVNVGILLGFQPIGRFAAGSRILPVAGLMLIVCGLVVRWLAILTLKRQFTVDVSITEDHRIISNGMYRFVRHPAYTGSLLSFLGLAFCFSNYLSLLIIIVPIYLAFLHRVRIEEDVLIEAFGRQYLDYRASTKRFIPGIL